MGDGSETVREEQSASCHEVKSERKSLCETLNVTQNNHPDKVVNLLSVPVKDTCHEKDCSPKADMPSLSVAENRKVKLSTIEALDDSGNVIELVYEIEGESPEPTGKAYNIQEVGVDEESLHNVETQTEITALDSMIKRLSFEDDSNIDYTVVSGYIDIESLKRLNSYNNGTPNGIQDDVTSDLSTTVPMGYMLVNTSFENDPSEPESVSFYEFELPAELKQETTDKYITSPKCPREQNEPETEDKAKISNLLHLNTCAQVESIVNNIESIKENESQRTSEEQKNTNSLIKIQKDVEFVTPTEILFDKTQNHVEDINIKENKNQVIVRSTQGRLEHEPLCPTVIVSPLPKTTMNNQTLPVIIKAHEKLKIPNVNYVPCAPSDVEKVEREIAERRANSLKNKLKSYFSLSSSKVFHNVSSHFASVSNNGNPLIWLHVFDSFSVYILKFFFVLIIISLTN